MTLMVVKSRSELQSALAELGPCTLVPTMGALHDGHVTLMREAKKLGLPVVVSVFVNPLQFGAGEDFDRYPRTLNEDVEKCRSAGAALVWAPHAEELTPRSSEVTVDPGRLGDILCGVFRPGHFRGVATIVTKLFTCVRPVNALFGWKDAQQLIILRHTVEDLCLNVSIQGVETVRESDGLAMSSRNRYLTRDHRHRAAKLYAALLAGRRVAQDNPSASAADVCHAVRAELATLHDFEPQYVECVRLSDLRSLERPEPGNTLLALAGCFPEARLIDNIRW